MFHFTVDVEWYRARERGCRSGVNLGVKEKVDAEVDKKK